MKRRNFSTPTIQAILCSLELHEKLLKQYRETGVIAAKPFAGGVKLKLNSEQLVSLTELIEANNDATLEELTHLFQEKTGVAISRATMGRMTQTLKMTVKKNTLRRRKTK
jgi:transposase